MGYVGCIMIMAEVRELGGKSYVANLIINDMVPVRD
jgi:hypothetical protein